MCVCVAGGRALLVLDYRQQKVDCRAPCLVWALPSDPGLKENQEHLDGKMG